MPFQLCIELRQETAKRGGRGAHFCIADKRLPGRKGAPTIAVTSKLRYSNRNNWGAGMTAIDFAAFVDELAAVSGETIRPFFRSALGAENKSRSGGFDPVTAADRAAESAMRALIKKTFPAHGVVGEELDADHPDAEYVWVLDPIDGTKSFICGMPMWGTLIALTRRGEPIYGMMHQPFTREHFSGDGRGARYRGPAGDRDLRVRACAALPEAIMLTTSPLLMN